MDDRSPRIWMRLATGLAVMALAAAALATAAPGLLPKSALAEKAEPVAAQASADTSADSTVSDSTAADSAAASFPLGDAEKGKKSYAVKCVACHMRDGRGGFKVTKNPTPDWRDAKRMADPKFNDAYLRDCITNGKIESGMVAWAEQGMKADEIENLIAYIHTFSEVKAKKKKK